MNYCTKLRISFIQNINLSYFEHDTCLCQGTQINLWAVGSSFSHFSITTANNQRRSVSCLIAISGHIQKVREFFFILKNKQILEK